MVRIGNFNIFSGKDLIQDERNLLPVLLISCQRQHIMIIRHIHHIDQIEIIKILDRKLPSALGGNIKIFFSSYSDRSWVGAIVNVIIAGACRINKNLVGIYFRF